MDEFNAREMGRKYQGTLAKIKLIDSEEERLVYFHEFEYGETPSVVADTYDNPTELSKIIFNMANHSMKRYDLDEFRVLPSPIAKVFDNGGITKFYMRNPNRQWQRGVCNGNSYITIPIKEFIDLVVPNGGKIRCLNPYNHNGYTFDSLANLFFDNSAKTFHNAIKEIDELNLMSRCINDKYFLTLFPHKDKQYILFRGDIAVAFYNKDKNEFILIKELYRQELFDFVRRNNIYSPIRTEHGNK